MKDWEKAEETVKSLIKGRRTPGSGNQHIRGDVRNANWIIEVKQTNLETFTLKSEWFEELMELHFKEGKEVGFFLFFGQRYYIYLYEQKREDSLIWSTKSVKENNLPLSLQIGRYEWLQYTLEGFKTQL